MKILPAIDLMHGKCVRLRQGRADDETIYSDDPVDMALKWQDEGAEFLHIVDLDGAFEGRPVHTNVFRALSKALTIPFEVGGGLRTDSDVAEVLDCGARRAILGSRAVSDRDAVERLVKSLGSEYVVVGIDARDGYVQTAGWTETSKVQATELAHDLEGRGVRTFICTDTATDGMLKGPNLSSIAAMCDAAPLCHVIASGGVGTPADVQALSSLAHANLEGVVIGKALYEKTASLDEFIRAART